MSAGALATVIDDHIQWFMDWHRAAFFDPGSRAEQIASLTPPPSFPVWYQRAVASLPPDQPMMDRLAVTHDQLHKLARLVLIKTPDHATVSGGDYALLAAKYRDFMGGVRQLERAFSVAASGLDLLTGLRSRVGMHDDLTREHNRFLRSGKPFCVAIMDIDHFKAVNDTYGHDAGDRALAAAANHVSRMLRVFDDAYRLGGEEFLLMFKEADLATGLKVLERLRLSLETLQVNVADGRQIGFTASFGLTEIGREDKITDLLHRADNALYQAKNEGRNRIVARAAES